MTPAKLTQSLKSEALRTGFSAVGVCPAVSPSGTSRLDEWLARGFSGEMSYFQKRRQAYAHPSFVLPHVRSLIMLATSYLADEPRQGATTQGRVSRYAWSGSDYHDLLFERTNALGIFLRRHLAAVKFRAVVDTAPLLEREFAQLAGLGWQGKNTLLLNKSLGSWFFLSALLTDAELEYDEPFEADHCGTCTACLEACPTQAFVQPRLLDATRCISYLTIEHRSHIPFEFRESMGDWVFGCDVCQDVCPWNNKSTPARDSAFRSTAELNPLELAELFFLDEAGFRAKFRATPLWRPRRNGLLRNAAIALGNHRDPSAVAALLRGLNDSEPIVRGACVWALGRIGADKGIAALRDRLTAESDLEVRTEIESALGERDVSRSPD